MPAGNRAYGYAELAISVSSLAMAVNIASTDFAYPQRDGQAELAWVAWSNTKTVHPQTVTHLSTNPTQRRVTSLMQPTMLLRGCRQQQLEPQYEPICCVPITRCLQLENINNQIRFSRFLSANMFL